MDDIKLFSFPGDECEALAMLYVQNQDLTDVTPEQLLDKYQDAYEKIKSHRKEKNTAKRQGWF